MEEETEKSPPPFVGEGWVGEVYLPRAPLRNQHDGANGAPMLIAGAPAGRRTPGGSLFARYSARACLFLIGSILFRDWLNDPELKRVQRDVDTSGKAGLALGISQSQTRREGRFCANVGAKSFAHIPICSLILRLVLRGKGPLDFFLFLELSQNLSLRMVQSRTDRL